MPNTTLINVFLSRVCLSYQLFQIALLGPFDDNKHLILVNEAFDVSDYELMLQLFQKFHLLHALISLLLIIHVEDLSLQHVGQ